MGAATVDRLLTAGCDVYILDVAKPADGPATFIPCDLADPVAIDTAIEALPARLDALVNVAGIPGPEPAEQVVRVNFLGLRKLTEALLPRINDGGSVVIVASVAGRDWMRRHDVVTGLLDTPDFDAGVAWCRTNADRWNRDPYTFSKQCAVAYTPRAAGRERNRGVRVNCVNPGAVETQLTPSFRDQIGHEQYDWTLAQVPHAEPWRIAEVIEYFAIGNCSWINGVEVPVDGGFIAGAQSGWINFAESPAARARAARKNNP
jgi:NAD(P)-dependent dehydrogenase (short-subunit alcohol dehydrogenase family)